MRRRDRAALVLITFALATACLAIGGATRWGACLAALAGVCSALPYLTSRRTASTPSVLLLPLVVMAALTLLQLVPLPIALVEVISPSKVATLRENARAWGDATPRWALASFDPPATLVELAKLAGYLGLAWTCVRLASEKHCRRWLLASVAGVAALTAAVTLAHVITHTRKVYGVYQTNINLDFVGPVVSSNHLASLLSIALPLAGVLALQARGLRRGAWFGVGGLLLATILMSGSRGGVLGMLAGITVTGTLLFVQRRLGGDASRPANLAITTPAALVAGIIIAIVVGLTAGQVTRDLSRTSLDEISSPRSKFQVWHRAAQMTPENRWLGVGKGGFEAAFTPHSESGATVYSHVENSYLQVVVDWGVPGAALIFLALGKAGLLGMRRWRKGPLEAAALGAIAALVIHDLADFSIELPAVAMSILVAGSVLFPERLAVARREDEMAVARSLVALRAGCVACGVLVVALAASPLGRSAAADYDRVTKAPAGSRLAAARAALDRHPASFLIAGRAAEALFAKRDPRALKMVARALSMNSNHAGLRHLSARMLVVSSRPAQAAGEFAAAIRLSRDVRPILADVLAAYRDPQQIAAAMPTEKEHAAAIIRVLGDRREAALAYARRVAQVHPHDAEIQALFANAALEASDGATALAPAEVAWAKDRLANHAVLLARAYAMNGDRTRALELLAQAEGTTTSDPVVDRIRLLLYVADLHEAGNDFEKAKTALERSRDLAVAERTWLAPIHRRLAEVEDRLGNRNQAEWERRRARELDTGQ
jgi:O-antigen ligase/tetratricopeptide (TPR) repeat protein